MYLYYIIISLFLFLSVRDLIVFIVKKDDIFLFAALFFAAYIVMVILKRFGNNNFYEWSLLYCTIFIADIIFISFICILLGDRYLHNKMVNSLTIWTFVIMFSASLFLYAIALFNLMQTVILMRMVCVMIIAYALQLTVYSLFYFIKSTKKYYARFISYNILIFSLIAKTFYVCLNMQAPIFLYAGALSIIIFIEISLIGRSMQNGNNPDQKDNIPIPTENDGLKAVLNEREFKIAEYLKDGCSYKEISYQTELPEPTVRKIIHNIYIKTGTKSRAEFLLKYI